MIPVTTNIALDENEIHEEFVRSSGAGGQNVNKVSTAVQLRFDVENSPSLPDEIKARLKTLAGSRLTSDGVLLIKAQSFRTQERNRQDALQRLVEMIQRATEKPALRRATKPTKASQTRRLDAKRRQSAIKQSRRARPADE